MLLYESVNCEYHKYLDSNEISRFYDEKFQSCIFVTC